MASHPTNLTRRASRDLARIVKRSADWFGQSQAQRMQEILYSRCNRIAQGENHGHRRPEVGDPIRFVRVEIVVIAYDPATRIIDGRRNLWGQFLP